MVATIRVGTSGWNYPHWRKRFYPQGLAARGWFDYYARRFDTVEINNTFYRLPARATVELWRDQAARGFIYAVKASRFLTHFKHLKDPADPLRTLMDRLEVLGEHLGPILYQLPSRWRADPERLAAFCRQLPRGARHVFEFRDRSWLTDTVYRILDKHGAALCVHDGIEQHPPVQVGPLAYMRLHGIAAGRSHKYSRPQLAAWAEQAATFERRGVPVYVYFNNDAQAHAVANAQTLKELLTAYV